MTLSLLKKHLLDDPNYQSLIEFADSNQLQLFSFCIILTSCNALYDDCGEALSVTKIRQSIMSNSDKLQRIETDSGLQSVLDGFANSRYASFFDRPTCVEIVSTSNPLDTENFAIKACGIYKTT